jgi:chromosomal replication initiation ATPase DnaA
MSIEKIISAVSAYYEVPIDRIMGNGRCASGHARRVAMFLAKMHTNSDWTQIGEVFGKHRTSVMVAARNVAEHGDTRVAGEIAAIERRLFA